MKYLTLSIYLLAFVSNLQVFGQEQPNVLIFITDDQHRLEYNFLEEGRNEDGTHKNLQPTLDKLVNEGIVFEQQHVVAGICTPSRYALLTGQVPSRAITKGFLAEEKRCSQKNPHFNVGITSKNYTIANMFKDAGYFTGGVGKNHVIDGDGKMSHRIKKNATQEETEKRLKHIQADNIAAYKACGFHFAKNIYPGNLPGFLPKNLEFHNTDWIIDGALEFLDVASKKENPFFLYCATTVSHGPAKLGTKYKGNRKATACGFLDEAVDVMPSQESIEKRIAEAKLGDTAKDALWLDDAMTALMEKLEAIGELDNTIIFFITDNAVEHGKFTCYEGGTNTPSVVWAPKLIQKGKRTAALASSVDIVPTMAEMCNITLPKKVKFDGISQLAVLKGEKESVRDNIYLEVGATRAIVKDGWKYLAFRVPEERSTWSYEKRKKLAVNGNPDDPFTHICDRPAGRGGESPALAYYPNYYDADQLYNLEEDPHEQNNLAKNPQYALKLEELKNVLIQELKDKPGTFGELKPKN
ncbi:sulfatase family protein [Carboxylicivirga marina]|uniref:Sulfatase-like hydrolase/transferase n=1 Tax=Carboxylicivirga marina TaxID=2800988 RepID=A0ABS1HIT0_9BACT|nr:sulfatase-like hydrolase/transferase [Carboxylicivirga marina]MBK3517526.1 sulfatase-like hydrolase/transferase [Carboxylicivirga marina]